MSLFNSLGRRAERLKQQFTGDDDHWGCLACEEVLDSEHDFCPHCGADEVVLIE